MDSTSAPSWTPQQRARLEAWQTTRSVDIHCHCLPGLDDGPETMAQSLQLCQALATDGLTTVVASPHQLGSYDGLTTSDVIYSGVRELQAELRRAEIPLEIVPGADVRVDERLGRLMEAGRVVTPGGRGRHLLLELPHEVFVDPLPAIETLASRGVQTIMTHPERHRYLVDSLARMRMWIEAGAVLQITAGSLMGDFGRTAKAEAWRLVDNGFVSLVATDAHDARRRPPRMTAAIELLTQEIGPEATRAICIEHPLRVFEGELISTSLAG